MKQLSIFLVVFFLFLGGLAVAEERCPLTGNSYVFSMEGADFELSGFDCTFGPGCEATCDLWYGNFEEGPKYYKSLPFVCETTGDLRLTIDQVEIPCALNSQGDLECFSADISGYVCARLGSKVWCLPEKPDEFLFKAEGGE